MHTLEPLCNLEQSTLLKELGFRDSAHHFYDNSNNKDVWEETWNHLADDNNYYLDYISRPTISMARNWVFREYGIWMQTNCNTIDWYLNSPPSNILEFEASFYNRNLMSTTVIKSDSPHICEFSCLTEILKHLKEQKDASKHV